MKPSDLIAAAAEIRVELSLRPNIGDPAQDTAGRSPEHLLWMAGEIEKGTMAEDKAQRWFGYLQAGLVFTGQSTLAWERDRVSLTTLVGHVIDTLTSADVRRLREDTRPRAMVEARRRLAEDDAANRDSDFMLI